MKMVELINLVNLVIWSKRLKSEKGNVTSEDIQREFDLKEIHIRTKNRDIRKN